MKKRLRSQRLYLALFAVMCTIAVHATVFPYVSKLQSFGGSSANTSTFTPIPGDYTLEVQGTVGTAITIAGGVYTYTPTTNGTVRFVQKSGVVYVYEGTTYMTSITPSYSSIFPTIADADVITSTNNLLQNASFETPGSLITSSTTTWNFGSPWVSSLTPAASGVRFMSSTTGNVNGTYELVWRGTANSNYFYQPISSAIKSNTFYKVVVRQIAGSNSAALFNIGLGSTVSGMEYGSKTMLLGNGRNNQYSLELGTPASVSGTTYFTFKNTATNTATASTQTDALTQLDYIELIEGTFGTPGITGVSSASFLEGAAYAPDVTVNYSGGDSYDMTPYILNRGFDNLRGEWTETPAANVGGYANSEVEFYSKTFNISQAITGLPAGIYQLKAQGFERAKANDAAAAYIAGTEVILSKLYATSSINTYTQNFNSLYLNAYQAAWGGAAASNYINTMPAASGAFTAGFYDMQLENIVVGADGALTIGAKKATNVTNSWTIMDNFRLYYLGPISDPVISAPQTTAAFTPTSNTATIDLTGANLASDITITVPSTTITLSGTNVTGTSPNYTIALANVNTLNSITATWDKTLNVTGNISFTSATASKTITVTTSDVETVALSGITLSAGGLTTPFAVGTTTYTAKVPADITSVTVTATTTPTVANVTNSGTDISATTTSVVLTGNSYNGSNHTSEYTVNWGGNFTFSDWAANGDLTSTSVSLPSTYGWKCMNGSSAEAVWNNFGSQSNCRYNDKTTTTTGGYSYFGTEWAGRILYIRWDAQGLQDRVFSYPVYLTAGTTYQINGKAAWNSNGSAPTLSFKINSANNNSGTTYATSNVITGASGALKDINLRDISVPTTGAYYLTTTSNTASLCAIADLVLNTQTSHTVSADNTWSTTTWSGGRTPISGDDITVSSGTLTIDQNASANTVTIAPGAKVTLNTGKTLAVKTIILQSDATGTATFVDNGTTTLSNAASVQQYLTTGRNWYVASPVTAATSGVFSASNTATNQLNWYDETSGAWSPITDDATALTAAKGYVASLPANGVVTFTGTLNNGTQTLALTRTAGQTKEGFNLVGNPYPSYLTWTSVIATAANADPTIWYRTHTSGAYAFQTFNATGNVGSPADVTGVIAPMQAFWVSANAGGGTLTLDNSMRSHSATTNLLKAPSAQQILRLQVSNGTNNDEAVLYFNANASNTLDAYDSKKMTNANAAIPEIYTVAGTEKLVINGLNSISLNTELPLGFTTGQSNSFTIKATQFSNFDANTKVILKDKLLGTEQDLTAAAYTFTSDAATTTDRFSVVFKTVGVATSTSNVDENQSVLVYRNAANQIAVQLQGAISSDAMVSVYNGLGQKLDSKQLTITSMVIGKQFTSGVYVVTVNNGGKTVTRKVTVN